MFSGKAGETGLAKTQEMRAGVCGDEGVGQDKGQICMP